VNDPEAFSEMFGLDLNDSKLYNQLLSQLELDLDDGLPDTYSK
jgi:hypothetical protein